MSGLLILRGLLFAAECFLASLLLPLAAFAVSAGLRRRAALRHLVFTTMFGVLAVLPLVALLLPPRRIVEHVAAPVPALAPVDLAPVVAAPPPSLLTPENIVLALVALWVTGLALLALRLVVGGLGLLRLRRASTPFAAKPRTGCDVRISSGENGPSTFGIFRPVILLPRSALGWPAARLDAVLRHEAAHVARRDTATQFIARLVCAVFWPNPLLWLAARSLRRDAEIAADDAVLASGLMPSLYAAELVSLAAERQGITPGIAMAGPPLAQRVKSVLADNSSRKGVTKMDMAKTATLGLTAALLLGAARFDLAVAQDAAPAPSVERNVERNITVNRDRNVTVTTGVPVAPNVENRVEKNVEVTIDRNVEIEAKAAAKAAAVRARADAVAARAQARAAAETDPVKKEQYRQEAAQVAAEAAKVTADADRISADVHLRVGQMAQTLSADKARAADMQQRAAQMEQTLSADKARADDMRQRAQTLLNRLSTDGARIADGQRAQNLTITVTDPQMTETVAKALADAHISETIAQALADAHIDDKTRKAIEDAHIQQRVLEAVAKVQPQIAAAISQARRTITVRPFASDTKAPLPMLPAPYAPPRSLTFTPGMPVPPAPAAPVPPPPVPG